MKQSRLYVRAKPFFIAGIITLCAVLIFAGAYVYVFTNTLDRYKDTVNAEASSYAKQRANQIANEFIASTRLLDSFCDTKDFAYLSSLRQGVSLPYDYAALMQLKNTMDAYFIGNDVFYEAALLFDAETPFVCASAFSSHDFRRDYENGLFSYGDCGYDSFMDFVRQYANTGYTFGLTRAETLTYAYEKGGSARTVSYIRRLPATRSGPNAYAMLFLDIQALGNALSNRQAGDVPVYLYDERQTLCDGIAEFGELSFVEDVAHDDNAGITYFRVAMDYFRVMLCFGVADSVLYPPLDSLTGIFAVLIAIVLTLAVALFFLVCQRFIRPIQRISNQMDMDDQTHSITSVKEMETAWNQLSDRHRQMQSHIREMEPLLRVNLLLRLLLHQYLSAEEQTLLRETPMLSRAGSYLCVIVGSLSEARFLPRCALDAIREIADKYMPDCLFCPVNENRFAFLIPNQADEESEWERLLQALEQMLYAINQRFIGNSEFAVGVGGVYGELNNVHQSYREAEEAYNEAIVWQNAAVIRFNQKERQSCYYPANFGDMDKLYTLLKNGEGEQSCQVLDEMVARVFRKDQGSSRNKIVCMQFCGDIEGILIRLAQTIDISAVIASLNKERFIVPFEETIAQFKKTFIYISDIVHKQQINGLRALSQELQVYIYDHYADPNLSLSVLADHFGMSETGLSKFFKLNIGINFFTFLEKLRLSKAENLLIGGDMPVKDIARQVGYINTATFYKAFKRRHGVPPGDWTERIRKGI